MFVQDFFVKWNDSRPFNHVFLNKVIGNTSKILGKTGALILPYYYLLHPGIIRPKNKRVSVSVCMTSIPTRIEKLWVVMECIIRQTMQPGTVLLYLSKKQFKKNETPFSLQRYVDSDFLHIVWVDEDIRSYKKFWYYIRDFPDRGFVTLDDDIIYPSDIIEKLLNGYDKSKKIIPACYCYKIKFDYRGQILHYEDWEKNTKRGDVGNDIFFGSGGGVYFPAGSLLGANLPYDTISQICPFADDIWLNVFVRKNGYEVMCVKNRRSVVSVPNSYKITLSSYNLDNGGNNVQLKSVVSFFVREYGFDPFEMVNE